MANEYNILTVLLVDEIEKIKDDDILLFLLRFIEGINSKNID